jgi:hypothetical protein
MTQVILDADLKSKLLNLTKPLELIDSEGQVLARVLPILRLTGEGPFEPQVSEEELKRRQQETESFTTAEVLAYLEKL